MYGAPLVNVLLHFHIVHPLDCVVFTQGGELFSLLLRTPEMCHTTHRHHKLLNLVSSLRSPLWVTHRYEVNLWECVLLSWGTALELYESNREGGDAVLYGSSQHTAGGGLHTALGRQGSVGLLGDQPGAYIRSNLLNSPFSHADFSPSLGCLSVSLSLCLSLHRLRKERYTAYTQNCNSVTAPWCTNSHDDTISSGF